MRKTILAAAAVAAFVSLGPPSNRVEAMTVASPTALGTAAADLNPVQQVRWGWHRHYGGWRRPWIGPWIGPPVYWGWHRHYWVGPWRPRPWGPHWGPYWGRPWGPYWGWRRPWW